jgi:peptide/nickel transport system permease protein
MIAYLIRRLLAMIPTLLGITFITFLIISLAPGDPVATSFGGQPGGGKSVDGGGGAQNQDRMADTIKAKKKLLGMVTEDYSVGAWSTAPPAARGADEYGQLPPLELSERLGELDGWARSVAAHGDRIYAGGSDGIVYVLSDGGDVVGRLEGHEGTVQAIAVSPAGDVLATGDASGTLKLWSLPDLAERPGPPIFPKAVRDLAFLPDGAGLLSAADDELVRLHDPSNGAVLREYRDHISGVYTVQPAADGASFWSGGYDRKLRHWSLDGELLDVDESHGQAINDIALSPDGALLATACDDRKIRLFRVGEGGEPATLEGHYKQTTAVAFSADGASLFSGGRDETVRSWDPATGEPVAQSPESTGRVRGLVAAPGGGAVLSAADSWKKVPIYQRYFKWLLRIATFDFDRSFKDDLPVIDKIAKALPVTLGLNILTILIIYLVSIPLGVLGAVKRGSTFDNISSLLLFILYSIPNFWLATLLIMFLSSEQSLNVLPSVGLHADNAADLSYLPWLKDWILHMILPITVMTYAGFASLSRYARTSMLETIQEDFIRTARAKGLAEGVVIWKHAFRNSLITIVTLLGNLLPRLIGGSVIVEYIFSINGMGKLGFDAILARDYPVIMAITTFSAFLTLLGILVSDLLYSVVDPRVSHK